MAEPRIGRNINTADEATIGSGVTLNDTTSTNLVGENLKRIFLRIDAHFTDKASWIKLQDASVDNDKKGIFLNEKEKGVMFWEMSPDNIYTGPVCGIADSGNPEIFVTEY